MDDDGCIAEVKDLALMMMVMKATATTRETGVDCDGDDDDGNDDRENGVMIFMVVIVLMMVARRTTMLKMLLLFTLSLWPSFTLSAHHANLHLGVTSVHHADGIKTMLEWHLGRMRHKRDVCCAHIKE